MKTRKEKTFFLNKLQIAKLGEMNAIKGRSIGQIRTIEELSNCHSCDSCEAFCDS